RLERLLDLVDLRRPLRVGRLAAEEIRLKGAPRRGVGFANEDLHVQILAADLLPVRYESREELTHLFFGERVHWIRRVHDDPGARKTYVHGPEQLRLIGGERAAREAEV